MVAAILHSWLPRIGDYTIAGWVICLGYLFAAVLCCTAFRRAGTNNILRWLWFLLGLICLFLSINKQLDLQTLLTVVGRHIVQDLGWYAERRMLQKIFVLIFALFSVAGLFFCCVLIRVLPGAEKLALAGALVLGGFVFIRAAAIHHVGLPGNPMIAHLSPSLLECTGITLVVAGALFRLRKKPFVKLNSLAI